MREVTPWGVKERREKGLSFIYATSRQAVDRLSILLSLEKNKMKQTKKTQKNTHKTNQQPQQKNTPKSKKTISLIVALGS